MTRRRRSYVPSCGDLGGDRRGSISVELAVTAPILFVVFFASVEFSRLNVIKNSLENAAYEGCRVGILPGATGAKCQDAAREILNIVGTSDAIISVTPTTIQVDTPQVTVDVSLTLKTIHGFIFTQFIVGRQLQASCTLQREIMNSA